jgi:hypothetical protein
MESRAEKDITDNDKAINTRLMDSICKTKRKKQGVLDWLIEGAKAYYEDYGTHRLSPYCWLPEVRGRACAKAASASYASCRSGSIHIYIFFSFKLFSFGQ